MTMSQAEILTTKATVTTTVACLMDARKELAIANPIMHKQRAMLNPVKWDMMS